MHHILIQRGTGRFRDFLTILLLIFSFPAVAQDCPDIAYLPEGKLMEIISDSGHPCQKIWLNDATARHRVIQRLDEIFAKHYAYWLDKHALQLSVYDSVVESGVDTLYLQKLLGDSLSLRSMATEGKVWRKNRDSLFFKSWDILFRYLEIDREESDAARVEANISWLKNHETLQYLSQLYVREVNRQTNFAELSPSLQKRNIALIAQRTSDVEEDNFVMYKSVQAGRRVLKDMDFFMDNDVFNFVPGMNQDRNYTGGGALTLSTDYLDMRYLNIGWLKFLWDKETDPQRIVMNYQSLRLGMHFFTPYIRYRDNFALADTLYQHDRPFASYIYLERSKYRLWPKGLVRHHGAFQIGQIGSNAGKNIQGLLHRDAATSSQKVYGWETQIANGGRWVLQLNHTFDFLLFSTSNDYKSVFAPNKRNNPNRRDCWKHWGFNLIGTAQVMWGGYTSAAETGLRIASMDFTRMSGQNTLKPNRPNLYNFAFNWELGVRYRYVQHNTTLEGFGYLNTYVDDKYDDEAQDVYVLNQAAYATQDMEGKRVYSRPRGSADQVNRNLLFADVKINMRWRSVQVYYSMTFHTKEFRTTAIDLYGITNLVKPEDAGFYQNTVIKDSERYTAMKMYAFGQLGVVWLVGK